MKRIAILLLTILLYSHKLSWHGNYEKALALAKKEHKKLLVLIVKRDTPYAKVIKSINRVKGVSEHYIPFIGFFDTNYPIELYYTTKFPTLFFVDPKNETFIREPLYGKKIFQKLSLVLSQ